MNIFVIDAIVILDKNSQHSKWSNYTCSAISPIKKNGGTRFGGWN